MPNDKLKPCPCELKPICDYQNRGGTDGCLRVICKLENRSPADCVPLADVENRYIVAKQVWGEYDPDRDGSDFDEWLETKIPRKRGNDVWTDSKNRRCSICGRNTNYKNGLCYGHQHVNDGI